MLKSCVQRIMILLLAVVLAAGLGLPAAQASAMPVQVTGMETGMENAMGAGGGMSMPAKCPDCDMTGHADGVFGCVMPGCTSQPALASDGSALLLDDPRLPHSRPASLRLLTGRDPVPDPYPPRTSGIV